MIMLPIYYEFDQERVIGFVSIDPNYVRLNPLSWKLSPAATLKNNKYTLVSLGLVQEQK